MSLHDVMQACSTGTGSHDLENSIYEKGALTANVYLSIVSSYLNDVHQNLVSNAIIILYVPPSLHILKRLFCTDEDQEGLERKQEKIIVISVNCIIQLPLIGYLCT